MQVQNWTSQIPTEKNNPIETLIKQLDLVKHIAESDYWLLTSELVSLLELDTIFVEELNKKLVSQIQDYQFSWRNFECILINYQTNHQVCPDYQFGQRLWAMRMIQDSALKSNASTKLEYPLTIGVPQTLQEFPSKSLNIALNSEIMPSPYALIENFLPEHQLEELLRYSIYKQPEFVPTTNSANDPNYRRSFYLTQFPEFSELMINLVRKITPKIITHLNTKNFAIGQIESQMTAHNHGNYYKIHNDNGSPDSSNRVLSYVYYYYKEPKAFTGGELIIYDSKIENGFSVAAESHKIIQPTNNTIVFFPSHCMHEVLPVSCPSEYFADSRFTINGWVRHK